MAAKKRKSRKGRKRGKGKLVCPKRSRGKKVHAAKGRCYIKTQVAKVKRKSRKGKRRKSRKGRKR